MCSERADLLDQFDFDFDWEALHDNELGVTRLSCAAETLEFDFDVFEQFPVPGEGDAEHKSRKHKRANEDKIHISIGEEREEDNTSEIAKAMRQGNFDLIMALARDNAQPYSIPRPPDASMTQRWARRKEVVQKAMRCMNFSDMNSLAQGIYENCHERVMFMSPEVRDPIYGKADMIALFSLMMEAYPDGVWKIASTDNEEDKVACRFSFRGTKVFPYPLETVLKQIKAHMNKEVYMTNSPAMASIQLVQDIAERVHPIVADRFREEPPCASATRSGGGPEQGSVARSLSTDSQLSTGTAQHEDLSDESQAMLAQLNHLIRPTKMLEAAVLQEGLVTYRRQIDFVFNEYDQIVRVIGRNLDTTLRPQFLTYLTKSFTFYYP